MKTLDAQRTSRFMDVRFRWLTCGLVLSTMLAVVSAAAQNAGPPQGQFPPGSPPPGPPPNDASERGHFGPPPHHPPGPSPGRSSDTTGTVSTMQGGLQLGPPGRWWDDIDFAKSLGLTADQKREMDAVFDQNRLNVLTRYETYQEEQNRLKAQTLQKPLDEPALMAEIERVGRARIALEQANTHMLVMIRALMNAEQISRLDSHR